MAPAAGTTKGKGKGSKGGGYGPSGPKPGSQPSSGQGYTALTKLLGTWQGHQGESYQVSATWCCRKKDQEGFSKDYQLTWDSEKEAIMWGGRFALYASDLTSVGPARWYRSEDRQSGRCAFTWSRAFGDAPAKAKAPANAPTPTHRPGAALPGNTAGAASRTAAAATAPTAAPLAAPTVRTGGRFLAATAAPAAAPTAATVTATGPGTAAATAPSAVGPRARGTARTPSLATLLSARQAAKRAAEAPFAALARRSKSPGSRLSSTLLLPESAQEPDLPPCELEQSAAAMTPLPKLSSSSSAPPSSSGGGEDPSWSDLPRPPDHVVDRLVGVWWGPRQSLFRISNWACHFLPGSEESSELRLLPMAWDADEQCLCWGSAFTLVLEDVFVGLKEEACWRWRRGFERAGEVAMVWVHHVEEGDQ